MRKEERNKDTNRSFTSEKLHVTLKYHFSSRLLFAARMRHLGLNGNSTTLKYLTCLQLQCELGNNSTPMMGSGTPDALSWRTVTAGTINSQPTPNLCGTCCSSWMHTSPWGPMEFIPGYSESWLMSLRDLSQLFCNGLENLERSQFTES